MNQEKLRKYGYPFGIVLILVCTFVYKFRFLSLPYYMDEAFPYSAAVRIMYNNGLSLMPGSIPPFVSKGHPLLFHFLAAAWMRIFGIGLLSGHSFAIVISILLVITIYFFGKSLFSERTGFIAALLFSCQAIFIAQSAFLLPEVLMALWAMLCFLFFFKDQKILFVFAGTMMLLTKEPGVIFFVSLFFCEVFHFLTSKERNVRFAFKKLVLISLPVMFASVFFIIQKIKLGWFFYPEHLNYISYSWSSFVEKFTSSAAYLVLGDGRNGITIFVIISVFMLFILRKTTFSANERKIIPVFIVFIVFYLAFSSVNYLIPRYLMCIFPPFIIMSSVLIDKAISHIKMIYPLIIFGFVVTGIFFYVHPKKSGDMDYSPSIMTSQQMVKYCEGLKLYDKHLMTRGILGSGLVEENDGYLSGRKFSHIEWGFSDTTEYCIFSENDGATDLLSEMKKERKVELVKRFQQEYAWCELYKVTR